MNTAQQLMTVKALIVGLQAAEQELKAAVLALKAEQSVTTLKTPIGSVSVAEPKETVSVTSEAGLLAWVEENYPTEVETIRRVRPKSREVLLGSLIIDGESVVDARGEIVQWAVVDQPDEYVVARLTDSTKVAAKAQVRTALDGLLGVLQIEAGS